MSNVITRFWDKVQKGADCWLWTGARNKRGYGRFKADKLTYAHRFVHELEIGSIPDGRVIDHLCGNTSCVNPNHLEAVTQRTNVRRGKAPNAHKTHCIHGHEFTPENTWVEKTGSRRCRACNRLRHRKE